MNASERALRTGRVARDAVAIVADLVAGAESLAEQFRFWTAILPRDSKVSEALAAAAGIDRTLQELRAAMRVMATPSDQMVGEGRQEAA